MSPSPSMQEEIASGKGLSRIHFQDSPTPASAVGPDIADSATIPAVPAMQRFTPAAARTGLIMALGDRPMRVVIINESSANTMTFAAAGTSNVANGVSCVISVLAAIELNYDPAKKLWYQTRAV